MNVFFLRHGEAGKRVPVPSRDSERSLTVIGKTEMTKVGRAIKRINLEFDKIASSPLSRALETAEIVAKFQKNRKVELWDELRPEGHMSDLFRRLSKIGQGSDVLLVGHDPFLTNTIGELVSGNPSARIVLKKGGLARVDVTSFNNPSGELRWLLSPKLLKKL